MRDLRGLVASAAPWHGARGREQEFRRWPKFKAQYLRTFGHMLEDRRALGLPVLEFASTPEQWFEWWLNDKAADKADGNQLTLWGYAEDRTAQPARLLDDIARELGVNISDLRLVPETKRRHWTLCAICGREKDIRCTCGRKLSVISQERRCSSGIMER